MLQSVFIFGGVYIILMCKQNEFWTLVLERL